MWSCLALVLLAPPGDPAGAAGAVLADAGYQRHLPAPPEPAVPGPRLRLPLGGSGGAGSGGGGTDGEASDGEGSDGAGSDGPAGSAPSGEPGGSGTPAPPPPTQAAEVPPPPPPPPSVTREPAPVPPPPTARGLGALPWVAFALFAIAALVVALRSRTAGPPAATDTGGADPSDPGKKVVPLPDPQALAASGHYAEAIHALLLVALADLARRAKDRAPAALTGRELVGVAAPRAVQSALQPLLEAVERTYFGTDPASADDFARCAEQARRVQAAWRA